MKKSDMKNLIWLIPDGARSIPFNDPLGRLPIFDEIKKDGFKEFKNVYSSATTTYMSIVSFLRGVYPTKMAYAYGELKATKFEIPTIEKGFKKLGFNVYFLTFYPDDLREQIQNDIFDKVDNKEKLLKAFYATDIRDIHEYNNYVLEFLQTQKLEEPYFLFIHVSIPYHPDLYFKQDFNGLIKKIYNLLKPKLNNANMIINSDHGFPFYTNLKDFPGVEHPDFMTQENIKPIFLTNFLLDDDCYTTCSLVDIYPTLCDIYNLEKHKYLDGISLVDKNSKRNLPIRIENRFPAQKNRQVVIIKDNIKMVYHYDSDMIKGYDLDDNEIQLLPEQKEYFFYYEKLFDKKRNEFIEYNFKQKEKKLQKLFVNKKKLIIKTYDNEFIEKFIKNYCKDDDIVDLNNINYKKLYQYDMIILLVESIYSIVQIENINNIKNISKEIYVIDRYLNIDEKILNKEDYLHNKQLIFEYMRLKKLKREERIKKQKAIKEAKNW